MKKRIISTVLLFGILIIIACCKNATIKTSTSTTLTEFNGANSASSKSLNGLSLSLSLDSQTYQPGQYVTIVIDEKNTLSKTNNVPDLDKWQTDELSLGPCIAAPIGIALLQGYYTSSNFSLATPLVIFSDPSSGHCPIEVKPSSYSFQPSSDLANLIVNSDPSSSIKDQEIRAEIPVEGYWKFNSLIPFDGFAPGVYTVVGGDEWGALVILHFTISSDFIYTTPTTITTINQQPIEVISVVGPFQPFYPGGPTVEITLKNMSTEPVISLTAVFKDLGPNDYLFDFGVNNLNPLLSDQIVSDKLSLINGAFSNNNSYPLTITGTLQNGVTFTFTQSVKIAAR